MPNRLQIAVDMITAYNAQDADLYVTYMTDEACEASYRGAVVREGKEGVRDGLKKMFAEFPENRAEIVSCDSLLFYRGLDIGMGVRTERQQGLGFFRAAVPDVNLQTGLAQAGGHGQAHAAQAEDGDGEGLGRAHGPDCHGFCKPGQSLVPRWQANT